MRFPVTIGRDLEAGDRRCEQGGGAENHEVVCACIEHEPHPRRGK